jgi:hypothetical protein
MSFEIDIESYPDSISPDNVCVTLSWHDYDREVTDGEVSFWLSPKERRQLRKALK